jgi:hypothetical protein
MRSIRSTSIRLTARLIIVLVIMSLVIAGGLLLRSPSPALAFKPTGYWRATDGDKTHTQLTEEAIRELILDEEIIPSVTKISRSMKKAIDEIKEGNSGTDLSGDYFVDEAHFTVRDSQAVKPEYTAVSLPSDLRCVITKLDQLARHWVNRYTPSRIFMPTAIGAPL